MLTAAPQQAHRRHIVLIVLACLIAYGAGFSVYFLKDDLSMAMFVGVDGGLDPGAFTDQLLWPVARTWDDIWRPVPALSWGVDFVLFGADPWAFHLGNILGHALNGVLLYLLTHRLLRCAHATAALVGSLCFALYPLAPEAVLWTTQRTVVFGVSFSLAALLCWHVWLHRGQRRHFALAACCAVLALLSREHALGLTPLMGLMALLWAPPARRWPGFFRAAGLGLLSLGVYFLCRWAIFGRFSGGYAGWPSMSAYEADNHVFEQIPSTVLRLFAPVPEDISSSVLGWGALGILLGAWCCAVGMALRSTGSVQRLGAFALCWLVLAWAPVLFVFIITPNLLNGRSGYHLMALPLAFFGATLALWAPARRWGWLIPLLPLVVFGALLGRQVAHYTGAGAQVRGLQTALLAEVGQGNPAVVVDVPTEFHGAPSVDAYLPWLVAPPYAPQRLSVVPLVQGLSAQWWPLLEDATEQGRPLQWFRACTEAPWIRPLFGPLAKGAGAAPELIAPRDLQLVRTSAAALPEIEVRVAGDVTGAMLVLEVPDRTLSLPVPLQHLQRTPRGTFTISWQRILEQVPELAAWPMPAAVFSAHNPLPVQWRLSVQDAAGRTIGVSAARRLLLAHF